MEKIGETIRLTDMETIVSGLPQSFDVSEAGRYAGHVRTEIEKPEVDCDTPVHWGYIEGCFGAHKCFGVDSDWLGEYCREWPRC